jgi:hypothetical protein
MRIGRTVRIDEDADGIWILKEDDQGERWSSLIMTAGDLHREGKVFVARTQRWALRPSYGGSVEDFVREMFG